MFIKIYDKVKRYIKDNYKFLIAIIFIIFIFNYEFPYVIYKSGGTIDLANRVVIDKEYDEKGKLQMSYVTAMRGTAPFIALSYVFPDWDLIPLKDITDKDSYEDVLEVGKEYMHEGIDNAIIAAFKESQYDVEITKEINKVIYISNDSNTDVKIGDEIISVNGNKYTSLDDLRKYINTLKVDDEIDIEVKNDNKNYKRHAKVFKDKDSLLKIGLAFSTTYEYETEIPVSVKIKNNESGSSGGLMTSLSIYNALTEEDITHGKNIVGTGTIDSNGVVGEIGGVKYKILGAYKNKADIFLCPEENYEEALKIKKKRNLKIEIVKVHTLKEAIDYLDSLD